MLMDSGCKVTGVDLEPEALRKADKFYNGPVFIQGDVSKAPWEGLYDWVVSFETIEHLPNPLEALKRFRESGVNLICSTPNQEKYPFDPKKFVGETYPHLRHYTPKELEELLREA